MNILNISINNGEATITAPWDCYTGTISVLGIIHEFRLYYKHVKASTVNFINHIIEVILPNKFKKAKTNDLLKILVTKLYDKIAEQEIERAMEKTRLLLGFAPEDFSIKRFKNDQISKCYTEEKKIIISPDVVKYDRKTIEYIVLHEFCHLKYKTHSKGFWQMMKTYMPNYEKYEMSI
ncbi:MAG: M48 family metallopeptidase [Clostridia bacterium]|nr:M48 family metallopeptidase [Clostridia bacterium]